MVYDNCNQVYVFAHLGFHNMTRLDIKEIVNRLVAERGQFATGDVAGAAGITRQAAHRHLRRMVAAGELVGVGKGRGSRYRRPTEHRFSFRRDGLDEDRAWKHIEAGLPWLVELPDVLRSIFHYATTEMVNNAIDHSAAATVEVSFEANAERIRLEVADDGVGAFERIRAGVGLANHLEAIQELTKGKLTTDPDRHSGEGVFFVSKIADVFAMESSGLAWTVDNLRRDFAIGAAADKAGTRVLVECLRSKTGTLGELFAEYTEDFQFSKSRVVVKLFALGVRFISRSEAKRLVRRLDSFREVVLDFTRVEQVGQGFVDEVFRVWARSHPATQLLPVHMSPAVEFMVRRGQDSSRK